MPEAAAVPAVPRLPTRVAEKPALPGVEARRVQHPSGQIGVVAHGRAPERVDDLALVALDVEDHQRGLEQVVLAGAVVRHREHGAAHGIQVRPERASPRALPTPAAAACSSGPRPPPARCGVPGGQRVGCGQPGQVVADVGVGARVGDQHRVARVPGLLPPRVERHLGPGVVRVHRRDRPPGRVVADDRADPDLDGGFEPVRAGEERLVLPHGQALVVDDRPAGGHPARVRVGADAYRRRRAPARPAPCAAARGRNRRSRPAPAGSGWPARGPGRCRSSPGTASRRPAAAAARRRGCGRRRTGRTPPGCSPRRAAPVPRRADRPGTPPPWRRPGRARLRPARSPWCPRADRAGRSPRPCRARRRPPRTPRRSRRSGGPGRAPGSRSPPSRRCRAGR